MSVVASNVRARSTRRPRTCRKNDVPVTSRNARVNAGTENPARRAAMGTAALAKVGRDHDVAAAAATLDAALSGLVGPGQS